MGLTTTADIIQEATAAAGVTVDGVLCKDGVLQTSAMPFTGTPTGAKFLRDDFSWQIVSSSIADGTYGDITVSGGGTVWTLNLTLDEIAAPVAAVDFNSQQAVNFVLELLAVDPVAPPDGRIWINTTV